MSSFLILVVLSTVFLRGYTFPDELGSLRSPRPLSAWKVVIETPTTPGIIELSGRRNTATHTIRALHERYGLVIIFHA